jgi:hypothetical protein
MNGEGSKFDADSQVSQIDLALRTLRNGGDDQSAAYYAAELKKARGLLDRLSNHEPPQKRSRRR